MTTADSYTATTLFAPAASTTAVQDPNVFTLKSVDIRVIYGAAASVCYFVIRRVPSGVAAPAPAITTGITTVLDQDNVLGFGIQQVTGVTGDHEFTWHSIRNAIKVNPGDSIILQSVSNVSSAGQAANGIIQYFITG